MMTQLEGVISVIAGAIIVLGAMMALVRSILKLRDTFRDNITATRANTAAINDLVKNQMTLLEQRMTIVEMKVAQK